MTHFRKSKLSSADKTLGETVSSWEPGRYSYIHVHTHTHKLSILSNHNQLRVGLIAMKLYYQLGNGRHRHTCNHVNTHVHLDMYTHPDYNHSGQSVTDTSLPAIARVNMFM